MKVTVAIPTHNRAFYLNQTLDGLMLQDYENSQIENQHDDLLIVSSLVESDQNQDVYYYC